MEREETASPTAQVESILLTAVIDAKEGRDVMTADIPNAFVQTDVPSTDSDGDRCNSYSGMSHLFWGVVNM
jgi:hypothetical protein